MDINVIKRDGTEESYDIDKVSDSIMQAALEVGGEDYELAENLAEKLTDILIESNITEIKSSEIEKMIQDLLIDEGHSQTATKYILFAGERNKQREMNTTIMRIYEDITFKSSEESDVKRENANIDSNSSMGTMLKYGSEGAKAFNLAYMIDPKIAKAHKNGDIHIHDLDFYTLTETCISKDTILAIKLDDKEMVITADELYKLIGGKGKPEVIDTQNMNLYIISNGKYTKVKNMASNDFGSKQMMHIESKVGYIDVTSEHRVSVVTDKGYKDVHAKDLKIGDVLKVPNIETDRFNLDKLDIIDTYTGDNLVIINTKDILNNIKQLGNWKSFCDIFDYRDSRYKSIRAGRYNMSIEEYKMIEHLTSMEHKDLKIAYKRTRSDMSIDGVIDLTYELGRFIGLMYSEGSITEHLIRDTELTEKHACFCNYDENLIKQFNECAKKVFNNAKLTDRKHKGKLTGTILPGYLVFELFHGIFGYKYSTDNIRLAKWMFAANEEFISGLMSGLIDGDGCVQKDGYRLNIGSVSKGMLQDIQKLLLMRGIETVITNGAEEGTEARFINDGKEVASFRKHSNYKLESTGNMKNKFSWIKSNKVIDTELKESDRDPYKYSRIQSITHIDYTGLVYDLETEDNHFDANGFNVHNCCQIPLDKLFEGGFNTGHGFLREPGNIRTAGALAAIAIQSNQNDQHKLVA